MGLRGSCEFALSLANSIEARRLGGESRASARLTTRSCERGNESRDPLQHKDQPPRSPNDFAADIKFLDGNSVLSRRREDDRRDVRNVERLVVERVDGDQEHSPSQCELPSLWSIASHAL